MSYKADSTLPGKLNTESLKATVDSNGDSTADQQVISNQAKLVEAKTAVIVLKHSRLFASNEYVQWRLKILFQPLRVKNYDTMNVLYLSKSRKAIWKPDSIHDGKSTAQNTKSPSTRSDTGYSEESDDVFVLSQRTNIMTMTYEYRIVYIVDLSSSLATVGGTVPTILLSGAFESLRNSLEGIVQPFTLPSSTTERIIMQPVIRLTVMADCSQFASNVNVIPMLAEHPTMRVFIQNAVINHSNIQLIISKLYEEFLSFQEDTTSFRNLLKTKRSNLGYDLDVGTTHDVRILDNTSEPTLSSPHMNNASEPILPTSSRNLEVPRREEAYHSSKLGEVWGQGKSGASLSRILHAGYFALKLLPPEGRALLVLITDGTMKSNVYDNTFVRQFADEDVTCHVIQVGSEQSFIPGRNFGFVPDREILLFLARATGGSFTYSDQCIPITPYSPPVHGCKQSNFNNSREHDDVLASDTSTAPPPRKVRHVDTDIPSPNRYHTSLLFRESCLTHRHSDQPFESHDLQDLAGAHRSTMDEGLTPCNFPWDPYAKPPYDALRVLRYREYPLPAEFSHVIASRAREGFLIHSVSFDDHDGAKISNTISRPSDTLDITAVKKERIQIVMTLHWQPNVVIEYRIRATWLPAAVGPLKTDLRLPTNSIFSRARAPRAEVFVRTEAEFAHMLQNWDVFRRRAQMMGIVTGATYFGDACTAPAYAKAERLKNYLGDIFEGDEVLKTVIGFNGRYMANLSLPGSAQHRQLFVHEFRDFWERLNDVETRARTRSWYDHANIDMLIGNVSPYMAPKLTSQYNQEFVNNIESEICEALAHTRDVLRSITDFEGTDGTFVCVVNRYQQQQQQQDSETQHVHQHQEDHFAFSLAFPPSFYEVRVRREYGRLLSLRLLFFNMDTSARRRTVEHILHVLQYSIEASAPFNMVCKRPFSLLLMRDQKHFPDSAELSTPSTMASLRAWYLPVAMWLTSEYIVRDYLRHMTCSWQTECHQDQYHRENRMMPIHDLAFQFLCQARLNQGYQLVSPRPDCTHFYQEVMLPGTGCEESLCALQYFIWKDVDTGKITTELWMEPNGNVEQNEIIKAWTLEPDRKTISQLVTFDQIHAIGRSKSRGVFKSQGSTTSHDTTVTVLSDLFDISSVLQSSAFVTTRFPSPRCKAPMRHHPQHHTVVGDNNATRPSLLHTLAPRQDISSRLDTTLSRLKEIIARLDEDAQSYALLHSFVVQGLEHISDGEIAMKNHDDGASFWSELQETMTVTMASNLASGTELVNDLRKMRCFIKVFDVRSFVIILFPHLDTLVTGLTNRTSGSTRLNQVDFILFECVRQKPLRPVKSTNTDEPATVSLNDVKTVVDNTSKAKMFKVDWLVHREDGLGETMRPQLYEGYFEGSNGSKTKSPTPPPRLTERALRVTQDVKRLYYKSFFRSFYTCLLRGFSVDQDDLAIVLELCDESNVEIDITGFVNVLSLQRRQCGPDQIHESEIQDRFMTIFRHFFEPIRTTQSTDSNLYYYRPPVTKLDVQRLTADERTAFLVDLVAYSQAPLLVRLEWIYSRRTGNKEKLLTVPATSLPTSFLVTNEHGKQCNFEPNIPCDSSQWSSLASSDTTVRLNFVFLNMPRSLDDEYDTSESVIPLARRPRSSTMDSQPTRFPSLSPDQREAFAETEARIQWLLTEETLHGLLKASNITGPILQYVTQQLGRSNLFVDYPTMTTMPLKFVKDAAESRRTFMDELEKECRTNNRYRLKRMGNYFYVCEDAIYNMHDEEQLHGSSGATESTTVSSPSSGTSGSHESASESTIVDHDDLCHGLGISTLDSTEDAGHDDRLISSDGNDGEVPPSRRPLYWLVLLPHKRNVQIFYYSKLQIHSDILNRVKAEIRQVQETTNRLMLLRSLQETRICSKYLEPSSGKTSHSDDDTDSDDYDESAKDAGFVPGQFSCTMVYAKHFPLHWRLQPNVALKYLTADVLRLFVVMNRPNMFVIERDNNVVYCKIYEKDLGAHSSVTAGDVTMVSSPSSAKSPVPLMEERKPMSVARNVTASTPGGSEAGGTRELVLEVYGIDLPTWIEQEFVGLLENRLVSQITLNEIQQFFLRNPNTKPTLADVRFILPVEKPPTRREVLRVPLLVHDPSTLILFFKHSALMDSLRLLAGPHVTEAGMTHNGKRFAGLDESPVDDGEICLYYNCTQRVPGSSTPLELAAGQGMAGICITATVPSRASTSTGYRNNSDHHRRSVEVNPDRIHACLESEFRESNGSDIQASCRVWIDIWVTGSTDADALLQYLYECFRQSLCDYFIEKTVTVDFGAALLQRALLSRDTKNISKLMRKQFIDSLLYILQTASRWKSPTVFSFDQTVQVMPWFMDDVLDYINCELCNIDTSLRMTVAWTLANQPKMVWELYQGQRTLQEGMQNHIRLVAISGINEFVERLGSVSSETAKERRTSFASDRSSHAGNNGQRSRRSSVSSHASARKARSNTDDQQVSTQDRSRSSSRSMSGMTSRASRNGPQADLTKNCFLAMTFDTNGIAVYTYNWSESASKSIFETIYRVVTRQETRNGVLTNILHQKMGLFHHVETLKSVVDHYSNLVSSPSLHHIMAGNHHLTPHIHVPSPKQSKNVTTTPTATPPTATSTPTTAAAQALSDLQVNTPSSTGGEGVNSSTTSNRAMPKQTTSTIIELQEIINHPTVSDNNMRDVPKQLDHGTETTSAGTTVRSNAARTTQQQQQSLIMRELDSTLANATACIPTSRKEYDLLKRHGIAFLKAVLRLSRTQVVQQKTDQICQKWYRHYEVRGASSDDDKLTMRDMRAVLRSARVFHYCRTLLLFSRHDEAWEGLDSDLTVREATVRWYRQMLQSFTSDYAKYLEGVGMQMVDVKASDDVEEDSTLMFHATQNLVIDSCPMYLLHVVQGASIICEIRFTSSNVSVTLYTLHGRYGEESVPRSYDRVRQLEEACGRFKNFIHVNSFVYDFHLRYIQQLLQQGNFVRNLDILVVLRQFCSMHKQPASYALNRVIHGFYQVDVDDVIEPNMFYDILLQSAAPRNGMQRVPALKPSTVGSAAVTSHDLSFLPDGGSPGMWQHTLIICPAQEDDLKNCERGLWLEYFVLVVYQGQTQPDKMQKNGSTTPKPNTVIVDAIDSMLLLDGYTMDDVATNARDRIDTVVAEVIGHCKRHKDWGELHAAATLTPSSGPSNGASGRNVESPRLTKLLGEFDHVDIREMDHNFRTLFEVPGLDWNRVFDLLILLLQRNKSVKEIRGGSGSMRHLLLYNHRRYMNYMIHLQLLNTGVVQGWMVCRESNRERTLQDPAVREQIVQLGATLCHIFWMESTSSSQQQQQQQQAIGWSTA